MEEQSIFTVGSGCKTNNLESKTLLLTVNKIVEKLKKMPGVQKTKSFCEVILSLSYLQCSGQIAGIYKNTVEV
jgi:hypothetical protein